MGKKYMSMQEELAARKAAAGIDEPARATVNRKEPEKEALSAKFKGILDKGTSKAKRQVRSRGQGGVPKIVKPRPAEETRDEGSAMDRITDVEDAEILLGEALEANRSEEELTEADWPEGGPFSKDEEKSKAIGKVIVIVVALMVASFAMMLFDEDYEDDGDDSFSGWEYYELDDITSDSTDEEIIARVNEVLEDRMAPNWDELNQWVADEDIGKVVGKDIKFCNMTAENKYIVIRAHFEEKDQGNVEEMCSEASDRVQEALDDADFDSLPSVLIIARDLHSDELLYFALDDDGYVF